MSLADGHPNSPDVCFNDCGRVSDASIVALAKQCIQLNSIDIGKCIDTTDGGHVVFPCRCLNLETEIIFIGSINPIQED